MKTIEQLSISEKRVFIRVDYNVPLENGQVADDTRLRATLATLKYALSKKAKIILASHLGRPKGKRVLELSLAPVAKKLSELLGQEVKFAPDCIGEEVERMVFSLAPGEILLLENLRFYEGETKNDPEFAKALAKLAEVYVNDAFAVCHRAHASVVGVPSYVSECGAGFLLAREIKYLSALLEKPKKPVALVIGGAKVSTKVGVLMNLLPRLDKLIVGGAMANTFLVADGHTVGTSFYEEEFVEEAKKILTTAQEQGVKVYLPVDLVVADDKEATEAENVSIFEVPADKAAFDIGKETRKLFAEALAGVATIVWNGPLGLFENELFAKGTIKVARKSAAQNAITMAGGGDTLRALKMAGVARAFSYLSTGGGAFLEFLEGKKLPGIEVLEKKS
ncbi:Phosphoglycerate kinase [Thermodesulfatator indicus DSM 15286]|uniref:Phosphoglycerate kinase n=1 Tax=Thermodesulfatator indicus (strain DSM 15286 / JCM 11887 / CIR29812) TaxID=667014 RepID=F8A9P4_THEID|nr:phosphoglycerate kinase [Thermodesulfatator indicus]AEH45277.1 Phosphoglycerate kinase [Thermodesulfatator indicus DSM 15286]